ncbi:hypothetical protein EDD86DRAFT_177758, partial [Gorgonomyces haynaldii]
FEARGQSSDETTQKLSTVTQNLVQLTNQNTEEPKASRLIVEHILSQDKKIRELSQVESAEHYVEALQSLQTVIKEREGEIDRLKQELQDTRYASRREQKLIVSAWYELGMKLAQQQTQERSSSWLKSERQKM